MEKQFDLVYCFGFRDSSCCAAVKMGWTYGHNSQTETCPISKINKDHKVVFIDQVFEEFEVARKEGDKLTFKRLWRKHLEVIEKERPKYATVLDAFDNEGLDLALAMAKEVEAYVENVIVIPKYDCIEKIPEKYMLGFSVPTTYGGTEIDIAKFAGHRVHLLGGDPALQYKYYSVIPEWVISVDTNYHNKMATIGFVWTPEGTVPLDHFIPEVGKPRFVAFTISCGLIRKFWDENLGLEHPRESMGLANLPLLEEIGEEH